MRLFGLNITRARQKDYVPTNYSSGGLFSLIREPFTGAWQRNAAVDAATVLTYHAVYACLTLIASDIAKLRVKLVERTDEGIWTEIENPAFSPVLRKPNDFQTRIQFWESWMLSKLTRGNTYALKQRDNRRVVTALYVLDPSRVTPLVTDGGDVYYEVNADNLAGVREKHTLPASEIIHDRWNCIYHPLCGVSPIMASGLAATQGLRIQNSSARFFGNDARPSGIMTVPGKLDPDDAKRLREAWESNQGGENAGRIAFLGGGLTYTPIAMTAEDAQLIDQLKWTAEVVCSTFHVPPYKIGVGAMPTYNNIQSLNVEYYSQCLQKLIEDAELCLDEGLGLSTTKEGGRLLGTEFDVDNLLRMDSITQMMVLKEGVGAGIMAPDEARRKLDLAPKPGGDSPYLQQQNYSLAALAKRDAKEDPFGKEAPPAPAASPPDGEQPPPPEADEGDEETRALVAEMALRKGLGLRAAA